MKEVLLAFLIALLVGSWLNGNQAKEPVNTLSGPQLEGQTEASIGKNKSSGSQKDSSTDEATESKDEPATQTSAHASNSGSNSSSVDPFEPIQPETESVR
jgi:cytoskeletal protein RodZ